MTNTPAPQQNGLLKVVRYFFGVMYLIAALGMWAVSPIFAVCYFLAAMICLPPTAKWIFEKVQVPNGLKPVIVILLLCVPFFMNSSAKVQPGGEINDLKNRYGTSSTGDTQNPAAKDAVSGIFDQMEQGNTYASQALDQKSASDTVEMFQKANVQFKLAQSTLSLTSLPSEYSALKAKMNETITLFIAATDELSEGVKTQNTTLQRSGSSKYSQAVAALSEAMNIRRGLNK